MDVKRTAPAAGIGGFVLRIDGAQHAAAAGIDQVDCAQVPARVAQVHLFQLPVAARDLEALALQAHRAVAAPLGAGDFHAEGCAQGLAVRAFTQHAGTLEEARQRGAAQFGVLTALVLLLDPGGGGAVEQFERELLHALEHGHQAALEQRPEVLLLTVLCGGVRQRGVMDDAQGVHTGGKLFGQHGRTVVGHERTRQAPTLQGLAQSVHQALGGLVGVPLDMAGEPGAVVEHAQGERRDPGAGSGQHLARAVVEVQVKQRADVVDLVAAHLARLGLALAHGFARTPPARCAVTHHALRIEVAADRRVRGQHDARLAGRRRGCQSAADRTSAGGRGTAHRGPR